MQNGIDTHQVDSLDQTSLDPHDTAAKLRAWRDKHRERRGLNDNGRVAGAYGNSAALMPDGSVQPSRLLRLKQVMDLMPLSRSTIYAMIARDEFPRQVSLGGGIVAWHEWEIARWIAERPAAQQ